MLGPQHPQKSGGHYVLGFEPAWDAPRGAGPLANGIELSGPHAPPDALPVPRRTSLPCLADAGWMACR